MRSSRSLLARRCSVLVNVYERGHLGNPPAEYIEFRFTDGSLFRIDTRSRFQAQFMPDLEGPMNLDIDYGVLGPEK